MFPNISLFDSLDTTPASGQGGGSNDVGLDVPKVVGISVPSGLCLIIALILIKQNFDRIIELIGRLNQLCDWFHLLLDTFRGLIRVDPEATHVDPPEVVTVAPRNLTDSQMIEMRCHRSNEQWI